MMFIRAPISHNQSSMCVTLTPHNSWLANYSKASTSEGPLTHYALRSNAWKHEAPAPAQEARNHKPLSP